MVSAKGSGRTGMIFGDLGVADFLFRLFFFRAPGFFEEEAGEDFSSFTESITSKFSIGD